MATLSFKINAEWGKVQRLREEISKLKQEIGNTNAIQNPTAFNNLNNKLQQTSKELGNVTGKIAQASATMETDFRQKIYAASQGVNAFTEKIIAQKAVVKDVAADVKRLGEAYRDTKKYSPMSADGKLSEWKAAKRALEEEKAALFGLTQEQATARLSVKRLNDEYKAFRQEGGGTAQTMDLLTSKMKGIAATVMGGMGLKELASRIISVRAEFESMETSLKVLLGGNQERLNNIMGQIKEYALASPLNTKDMVGAVQMMTSFGIEAEKSIDYLKAIGDISMGNTGKFNSLALAFSQMSSAGKLMGQDLLQMVNAGFNPLEEISRKTGKSIGELKEEMSKGAITSKMVQDAFISVTSAGGKFYGMSAEGAKMLNGQLSMLQESFDNMFNEIGSKGEGVVMTAVQTATKLVENYEQVGRVILGLIETYGAYRVGLAIATVAENGHTLAMTLARAQILLTQKAQALLNATMLANPYVLAATALGVLIGAMVMQKTQTDRVNDATERYNEEKEKIIEQEKRHTEEIQRLCDIAGDESLSTDNRRLALVKLEQKYPSIFKKYDTEAAKLAHILEIKQQIAVLDGGKSITNAKNEEDRINKRLQSISNSLKARQTGSNGYKDNNVGTSTQSLYDEQKALQKRKGEINKQVSKSTSDAYLSNLTGVSNTDLNRQIKQRKNLLAKMSLTGKKYGKTTIGGAKGVFSREEIEGQIGVLESEKTKRTHKPVITKKDLQDQKKALQTQLDGLSEIEAKGKKGAAIKKKIAAITARENAAYSTSSSSVSGKTGKGGNVNTFDPIKAQSNIDAQKAALSKAQIELENQVEQSRIDALQEGNEKTLAAMKLAHKKELEQIDKQKEEYLKKKQDEAEAEFKADPKNKDKKFDGSKITLTAADQKQYDEIRANTIQKQQREDAEAERMPEAAMRDYLKQYGTYQEKKVAIAQEYAEKIAKATTEGEKKSLRRKEQSEYNNLDLEEFKKNINWEYIFGNLDNVDAVTAGAAKDQLEQFINLSKELTPEQIKTVTDAMVQLQDKMDLSDPLRSIKDARKEYALAKTEFDKYSRELDAAKVSGDAEGQKKATEGMIKSSQKMSKAKSKEKKSFKAVTDLVQEYARALQEAGDIIGGTAGECVGLAASALSAGISMAKGIKDFGEAVSTMEKAVAILAIIEAALQAIRVIMNVFGDSADATLTEYVSTMDTYIKLLDDDINSLNDSMGDAKNTMKETIAYYDKLVALEKESALAVKSQSQVWLNSGASKGFLGVNSKASEGVKIVKQMKESLESGNSEVRKFYEDGYNALNEFFAKVNGRMANSVSELGRLDWIWKLSDEDLAKLSEDTNAMAMLGDTLSSAIKEYVDKMGTVKDKLNEEFASLLNVSYDEFYDGFTEMISEMDNDSQNFSDHFAEYMRNALIKDMVASQYKSQLESLYKQAGKYAQEGTLDKHVDELRGNYARLASSAQEQVRVINDITGYTGTDSQNATANGISNISYDQADNLTGIMTSMQIAGEQRNAKLDTVGAQMTLMNTRVDDIRVSQMQTRDIANDTRDILANSYMELKEINLNTGNSEKHLKEMKSDISDMKKIINDKL